MARLPAAVRFFLILKRLNVEAVLLPLSRCKPLHNEVLFCYGHEIRGVLMCLDKYKDLLSVQDLMEIFGVSKSTIYKEIQEGKFGTPIQIGRAYKIPRIYVWNTFFANYQ